MPFHFETIPSTQTFLKEHVLADQNLPHLEFALADEQSGGVGRHGRSWISERGNLFLSLYIKQHALPLTWIPHWMGLSLIDALESLDVPPAEISLKWPNDLMLFGTRKAAGILCEKVGDGVVVGVGVNLLSAPTLEDRETGSISQLLPKRNFEKFNHQLAQRLIDGLRIEPGLSDLKKRYEDHSLLKPGRELKYVDLQTQKQGQGKFVRFGEFGELVVEESGVSKSLYSEEIKVIL